MNEILISISSMVGLGVFFAVILAIADKTMGVKEDKRIADIEGILPGLNCGACGYAGCYLFAIALSKGDAEVTGCLPGGEDTSTKLAELLGLEKAGRVKSVAVLHCNADFDRRKRYADYKGIMTCEAANKIFGAGLACDYGCLGYGDCVRVCPFGAITMANGLPIVDSTKCTACGKCVKACPRGLYSIEKFIKDEITTVACSSLDKGAVVKEVCGVGCTACKVCEKLSKGVFEVKDNLARVHYDKVEPDTDWDKMIKKCPTKVIVKIT
ncbi:RnfABCDGE type electron transport complex subunit B [Omnitrophica bacterium]|nr:RnfABCDGE type electron transport complex subunit B [Candidatus Omnitrophota bacterium]